MGYIIGIIALIVVIGYASYIRAKKRAKQIQESLNLIRSVTPTYRGTASERYLILTLLRYGINSGAIFHDLYIFRPDGKTSQVDVVVATSVGIIVFEVKDFSGWIYGKGNQQKWTQVLAHGREKNHFYNPVLQNKAHITQLKRILKEDVPFYNVVVFYGNCELRDVSFIPENTFITRYYRITDVVKSILRNNSTANYKNKRNVMRVLKKAVANGNRFNIEEKHIKNIHNMLGDERVFK